ncbi:pilus assembly PilX N-terminal domain-containing protein [Kurthia gibsonii]|uniref:pilus assembly PilX N-terminal domain-containing protein n=1 Tax=Kurthia gibsonii TaxID=33946 RepID=UPI001142CB77|nr:pilus assembly PilX N-terminal domain-containing protein [Kurthia gibsonii]GED19160.1 hypothetical protein KGI01_09010 [Kurthia gibsonii]
MRKYVKSNDGYALVIALLVITVVTVLGLGILTTTSSSKKLSEEENKDQTAYYIAEAGLNQKKEELKIAKDVYDKFVESIKDQKLTKEQFLNQLRTVAEDKLKNQLKPIEYGADVFNRKNAKANVKTVMTVSETELKFTITSTGIIKSTDSANEKKRTVQSVDSYNLAITEKPAEEEFGTSKYVVHALGDLSIINGKIVGNLGFAQPQTTSNTFPFIGNSGDAYYIGGTSKTTYKPCPWWENSNTCGNTSYKNISVAVKNGDAVFNDSELPKIPEFPKEKFISLDKITDFSLPNSSFEKPSMSDVQSGLPNLQTIPSGKYKVTVNDFINKNDINIGSNDVTFVFDNAIFNDYRSIKISGKGNITIVCNTFEKSNNGDIDFEKNNLKFYSQNFKLSNSTSIKTEGKVEIFNKNNFSIFGPASFSIGKDFTLYNQNDFTLSSNSKLTVLGEVKIFNKDELDFKESAKLSSEENVTIYSKGKFSQIGRAGIASAKNLEVYSEKILINAGEELIMNISENINFYAYKEVGLKTTFKMNSKNTNLYYIGETKPEFTDGFNNNINFDFLNSSIKISNGFNITGNIILRGEKPNNLQKVEIIGGLNLNTPSYFFAPKFDMKISNGATVFGSVIGKNIEVTDGAKITYKQPPPNNGGSTGGATGGGSIDSSLTPNSDGGSIEVNNP